MPPVDQVSQFVLALDRLSSNVEKISDRHEKFEDKIESKIDTIQNDVSKFAVLFEKLVHIEKTHEENNKRVHYRIDEIIKRVDKVEHTQEVTGCPVFREMQKEREQVLKQLQEDKEAIRNDIKDLKDKPKKRMEVVVVEIIKATVIFVLGAIAFKLGIKQ